MIRFSFPCVLAMLTPMALCDAAELILPDNRNAYYTSEPIELAVVGVAAGGSANVELVPAKAGLTPVKVPVKGDGSTVVLVLPAFALAPSEYAVKLDGQDAAKLTVSTGVTNSPMLVSQTSGGLKEGGANFTLGNAFSFGRLDPQGQPAKVVRGQRSMGLTAFENAIAKDMQTIVYMYWTGYVTHKPFGTEKSWANDEMVKAMRLLNFSTAQRLRRYSKTIHAIGTLDEPGLSWGKTPAGGMASGFPNWDEKPWYAARGWEYTDDPGSRSAEDFMKYLTVRCDIMKQNNLWAKQDIKTVHPDFVFSTDLYAPQAVMDGTDPLNQQINELPASHVFVDWGCGKLGALSGLYLEKADDPTRKMAHAMNGQLFGEKVPQPNHRDAYHLMMNAMIASGLHSNWWLNNGAMSNEDLTAVNEPAARIGPLFHEMELKNHDVAVLWSFTEVGMRQKDHTAKEAKKKTGEQIKLMIASLPEESGIKDGQLDVSAYTIGQDYKDQILMAHQALARAGYPTQIIHEKTLPNGSLKQYKTLVIIGQTFGLPDDVTKAIAEFQQRGGKIVVDRTTKVPFADGIVTEADFRDAGYRWNAMWHKVSKKDHGLKNDREASYYHTNYYMDEQPRLATPAIREAMKKTDSKPAFTTDTVHLAAEKHAAGEGALYMVINANDKLPEIPEDKKYFIWNYAPIQATFALQGVAPESVVYAIEGTDWKKVTKLDNATAPQNASFAAGEMKLYLVAPRAVEGIEASAKVENGNISVTSALKGVKMPWPLTITVKDASGAAVYTVYRSMDAEGKFAESFPLGSNAPAGAYAVTIESPAGGLSAQASVQYAPAAAAPTVVADAARVFDEKAIKQFITSKPEVVIITGNDTHKPAADKLVADLSGRGIKASIKPASEAVKKVNYPRVWNPFAKVYTATGEEKAPAGMEVKNQVEVSTEAAKGADGKPVEDWKAPNTLVTIGAGGLCDATGDAEMCFEPGVKLYFDKDRAMHVVKGEMTQVATTNEFKVKWAKPWSRLASYVGGYQLPAQLPEAYTTDAHLIVLGDSETNEVARTLQASEMLQQIADEKYPGPGKALVSFVWSPFAVEKNVILIAASDANGLSAGVAKLAELMK